MTERINQWNGPSPRIALLTDQMEQLTRNRLKSLSETDRNLVETLAVCETIRINNLPRKEICARLRGLALDTGRFSPAIAAHMELIADEYDGRPGNGGLPC